MSDMRTIVVGYDGEEPAARALDRAIDEAQRSDSRLVVVAVSEMTFNPEGPQSFGALDDTPARMIPLVEPPEIGPVFAAARERIEAAGLDGRLLLGRRGTGARDRRRGPRSRRRHGRARIPPPQPPFPTARNGRCSRGQALGRL